MGRWLICRREFFPCLLKAVKREGPYGNTILFVFVITFIAAIGLTVDCLVDIYDVGNDPFIEIFGVLCLYAVCGFIFFRFGNSLLTNIREQIAEIDSHRRRNREDVIYRRVPNQEEQVVLEDNASDSSGAPTDPSGYGSLGAISNESDALSAASISTAAASAGSASLTSGYASAEPQVDSAEELYKSSPVLYKALTAPRGIRQPGTSFQNQPGVIQTQPGTSFQSQPGIIQTQPGTSFQSHPGVIQTQPRRVTRSQTRRLYAPYQQEAENSELRSGRNTVKDPAVLLYEELKLKRSEGDAAESKAFLYAGYKSLEEMHAALRRKPLHVLRQQELPAKTSPERPEEEAYSADSDN